MGRRLFASALLLCVLAIVCSLRGVDAVCGNNVVEPGEQCDNTSPGGCCTTNCLSALNNSVSNPSNTFGAYTLPYALTTTLASIGLTTPGANYPVSWAVLSAAVDSVTYNPGVTFSISGNTNLNWNRVFVGTFNVTFQTVYCNSPFRALYFYRQLSMTQFGSCTCVTNVLHPWCTNSPTGADETKCDCFTRQCYRRDSSTPSSCGSTKCRTGYQTCNNACSDILVAKPRSFTLLANDCPTTSFQCTQNANLACTCNAVCGDLVVDLTENCDLGSPAQYGSCCTHNCTNVPLNPSPSTGSYFMPTCATSVSMSTLGLVTGGSNYVVVYELVSVTNVTGLGAALVGGTTLTFNRTVAGVAVVTFRTLFCNTTSQYLTFTRTITGYGCCGNSVVEYGEVCDVGATNGQEGSCCTTDCQPIRLNSDQVYSFDCYGNKRFYTMAELGLGTANFETAAIQITRNQTWYLGVGETDREWYADWSVPTMVSNSTTTQVRFVSSFIGGINLTFSYNYCSAPSTTLFFNKQIWVPRCYCNFCDSPNNAAPKCGGFINALSPPLPAGGSRYRCDCSKVLCVKNQGGGIGGNSTGCSGSFCDFNGYTNCSVACADVISPKPISFSIQNAQTQFGGAVCTSTACDSNNNNPNTWTNCTCASVCGDDVVDTNEFCDTGSGNGLSVSSCCTTNCQAPVTPSPSTFSYTMPTCADRVALSTINILQTGGNFVQAWSVANYTGVTGLSPFVSGGDLRFGDPFTGTVVFTLRVRWCNAPNQYLFVTRTITNNNCCDNGIIDPGEECDLGGSGNGGSSTCCSNNCQFRPTTRQCRASVSACDAPEFCTGTSDACPANVVYNNTIVCRPAAGACDVAETCNGVLATCPADTFLSSAVVCRNATDVCDVQETCTGSSATCPVDAFRSSSTVCRNATGACDVQETCTGSSAACPADAYANSSVVCRTAADVCDQPETCTGASPTCPSDLYYTNTRLCRNASDVCDVAEYCTGVDVACPTDFFVTAGTTCRAAVGDCDAPETCTGSDPACPADAYRPTNYTCRSAAGVCDVEENCTGVDASCPADAFVTAGTECRAAAGDCDVAETCTGASVLCPVDALRANGYMCRDVAGPCDWYEYCTGVDATCPPDAYQPQGVVCRGSSGVCDPQDVCSGDSVLCVDVLYNASVMCRASQGICDLPEYCTGVDGGCPADVYRPSTDVCRNATGPCDVAENCTGSAVTCPTDAIRPSGYVCAPAVNNCTITTVCSGLSTTCPNNHVPAGTRCYDNNDLCFLDECDGSGTCAPGFAINYDDGRYCNGLETCDSATGLVIFGTPPTCDDSNSCTSNSCDNVLGACVNTPLIGTYGPCGSGVGACVQGNYTCDGTGPAPVVTCTGEVGPTPEVCFDLVDNNCNGATDEGCNGQPCLVDEDCENITRGSCDAVYCSASNVCNVTLLPDGAQCNDWLACTRNDTCMGGICSGTPVTCDDSEECTYDYCAEPYGRCVFDANILTGTLCPTGRCSSRGVCTPPHATCPIVDDTSCVRYVLNRFTGLCEETPRPGACTDNNACTEFDTCINGTCVGMPKLCDDYIECTVDTCVAPAGTCEHAIISDTCYIDGRCWPDGAVNTECGCRVCNTSLSTVAWSLPATALSCNDGDACTENDACNVMTGVCEGTPVVCPTVDQCLVATCTAGACRAVPLPQGTLCDDGDSCTVHDVCELGKCRGVPLDCSNYSTPCTVSTCVAGFCLAQPIDDYTRCDPTADVCAGVHYCVVGMCVESGPVVCPNTTNQCTEYVCDAQLGCVEQPRVGQACDDGNVCTSGDVCSADGVCSPGGLWTNCDDGNDCTDDLCLAGFGCTNIPILNCQTCNVTSDCSPQTCQQVNCVRGQCRYVAEPAGFSCSDGDACNGQEVCTGNGVCVSLGPFDCDDGNPCTNDTCNVQLGCIHTATPLAPCNDSNPCTVSDACTAEAVCVGEPYACPPDSTCLEYSCVLIDGAPTCLGTPINRGSFCTTHDSCMNNGVCDKNGVCIEEPLICPAPADCVDSYSCYNGTCVANYVPDGTLCNIDNLCKNSICAAGTCLAVSDAVTCTPSECETDSICIPVTGECAPVYAQDGTPCDDADLCTQSSHCLIGRCVGADPRVCVAPDACHEPGTCNPGTGLCSYTPLANNTPCPGSNPNASSSTCLAGVCVDNDAVYCAPSENECLRPRFVKELGCVYEFVADGTACDDNDICTSGETCQSGQCVGGAPYNCSYGSQCAPSYCLAYAGCISLDTGVCDRQCVEDIPCPYVPCKAATCDAGVCVYRDDDTATSGCDDGQFCTGREFCFAGTCHVRPAPDCYDGSDCTFDRCDYALQQCRHTPTANISCESEDLCAVASRCDGKGHCLATHRIQCDASAPCRESLGCNAKTGACDYVFAEDGTECELLDNKCAARAVCYSGVCHVVENVTCAHNCACDAATTCDPLTGYCVTPTSCNRELCSDGDLCTLGDRCNGDVCVPGEFSPCELSDFDVQCQAPRCSSADGTCVYENLPDGLPCDTGVGRGPCSGEDVCQNGACVRQYDVGTLCREAAPGGCDVPEYCTGWGDVCPDNDFVENGTPCPDSLLCYENTCQVGRCLPTRQRDCSVFDGACTVGVCSESTGACVARPKSDHTPCISGLEGQCVPFSSCEAGVCTAQYANELTPCSDGTACSVEDHCSGYSAICVAGQAVSCEHLDGPCSVGVCNPLTGACVATSVNEGVECNADMNPCTFNDTCRAGVCVPGGTLDCSYLNSSCQYGTCIAVSSTGAACIPIFVDRACDPDYCTGGCTVPFQWWSLHNSRCRNPDQQFTWPAGLEDVVTCQQTNYYWSQRRARTVWLALFQEWLAATLNSANGACVPATVSDVLPGVQTLLAECDLELASDVQAARLYKSYAIILKTYNSGMLGPGECTQAPCATPLYDSDPFGCLFQTRDDVVRSEPIDYFSADTCENGMWDYVSETCQCFVGWAGLDCTECDSGINPDETFICVPSMVSRDYSLRSVPNEELPYYFDEDVLLEIVRMTGRRSRYPGDGKLDCACQRPGEEPALEARDFALYIAQDDTIAYIDTISQGLQLCEQVFDVTVINANPACNNESIVVVTPDNDTSCAPPDWHYICDCCGPDDDDCVCPRNDVMCIRNHMLEEQRRLRLYKLLFIIFASVAGLLLTVGLVLYLRGRGGKKRVSARAESVSMRFTRRRKDVK